MSIRSTSQVLLALLLGVSVAEGSIPKSGVDHCSLNRLPTAFQSRIARLLPGWRLVSLRDLDHDDRAEWLERHPTGCPGLIKGHFGPGRSSGWVLAMIRQRGRRLEETVLYIRQEDGKIRVTFMSGPTRATLTVISKVPPGRYAYDERTKHQDVPFDGVLCTIPGRYDSIEYLDRSGIAHSLPVWE